MNARQPLLPFLPFAPASQKWLRELEEAGKSRSTLDCYARDLRDVAKTVGGRETQCLTSLDQRAVDAIAGKWLDAGACAATVSRRFSALRGFAVHLVRQHGMDLSALLSAEFPSTQKGNRPPVVEDEITLLLSDAQHDTWRGMRDSALFAIQSSSGLTPAETVGLDVRNVALEDRLVHVVNTHLAPRVVGLSDQSGGLIRRYLGALPFPLTQEEPLFVTSTRKRLHVRTAQVSFRRRRMRLGVSEGATLMGLRHALAARLASDGGSPDLLASALGVLRSTTSRYFDGKA
jgi:integrase/recombinase XerC